MLEPPVALNTARISEGLLSLRFPRTRLFAASAPVCIQVLASCISPHLLWLVRLPLCVHAAVKTLRAVHAPVCCEGTGLPPGVIPRPTGGPAHTIPTTATS